MVAHRRIPSPRKRGVALVLTLFTIAVLVTLSTSFTILAFNESKTSRGEKNGKLAYGLATAGLDAVIHYMSSNANWVQGPANVPDPLTPLSPSFTLNAQAAGAPAGANGGPVGGWQTISIGNQQVSFLISDPANLQTTIGPTGFSETPGTGPPGTSANLATGLGIFSYQIATTSPIAIGDPAGAAGAPQFQGLVTVFVQRIGFTGGAVADPNFNALNGNPIEVYFLQSTAQVFQGAPTANATPLATRTVLARVRDVGSTDSALTTVFAQAFDAPGFNKQFTVTTADQATAGLSNLPSAQTAIGLLNTQIGQFAGADGVPFGDSVSGQVNLIKASSASDTANPQLAANSGQLQIFGNAQQFFNGTSTVQADATRFAQNVSSAQPPVFPDLSGLSAQQQAQVSAAVFAGGSQQTNAPGIPGATPGQPPATTQVPVTPGNPPAVATSATVGSLESAAIGGHPSSVPPTDTGSGTASGNIFMKVASEGGQANPVNISNPGTPPVPNGSGAVQLPTLATDIEVATDANGVPIQGAPPGIPKVVVSLSQDGSTVTVQKIGAYSGNVLETQTESMQNLSNNGGLIYVDGGNVQVNGNFPDKVTIVAGPSSDRPTVDASDPTNPNLIPYPSTGTSPGSASPALKNSVFLAPDNPVFTQTLNAQGQPTGTNINPDGSASVPAIVNGQAVWPSFDPTKLAQPAVAQAFAPSNPPLTANGTPTDAQASLITHDDVTTREGNLTVTGNINSPTPGNPNPTVAPTGLLAQNFILLSDQTAGASAGTQSSTLSVNATLQSFSHSVQFGGFVNTVNDPGNPGGTGSRAGYFSGLNVTSLGGINLKGAAGVPLPLGNQPGNTPLSSGTFNLKGSIIAPFLDTEGALAPGGGTGAGALGYDTQKVSIDTNAQNNPPPFIPTFSHLNDGNPQGNLGRLCQFKIEAIIDQGALVAK